MKLDFDFDLSREQLTVVVLVLGLVVSAVAISPGMVFGPPDGPSDAKSGVTYRSEPADPAATGPPGDFEQSELMAVPDGYTQTRTEAAREPPEVQASAGAQTMQVSVVEDDGEVALKLADDRVHDGRWVSMPASWFEAELGQVPEVAYVAHESGDEYKTRLHARGRQVAFYVEEFSTNTVTFSGEVSITGNFSDGGSAQYELSDYDSASDPLLNLIGLTNTEWDNVSAASVGNGGTVSLDPAGNMDPSGPNGSPTVTFTGVETSSSGSYTTYGTHGFDTTTNVGGNLAPTGESLTITGHVPSVSAYDGQTQTGTASHAFTNPTDYVDQAAVDLQFTDSSRFGGIDIVVYIGGSQVASASPSVSEAGTYTVNVDQSTNGQDVTIETTNNDYEYTADRWTLDGQGPQGVSVSAGGTTYNPGNLADGETVSYSPSLSIGSNGVSLSKDGGGPVDYDLSWTENAQTNDPAIDVDGDGTTEASYSGKLANGETVSRNLSSLTVADNTGEVSLTGGAVDMDVSILERTQTTDTSIDLNSKTLTHSGPLGEGETVSMTYNQSVLQEGTNQLNVSVGDGTLSSDAPTPMVDVNLTHDAVDQHSVEYGGGQWTESYNVTETYASSRQSASLTVPFQSNVYAIQNVEAQTNGTGWSSLESANYNLSDTTLTVDLNGVYGGEIPEGTTMDVRTTGTTVDPIAGTIQVTDPSTPDHPLNSTVELVDWGPDSALDISGTPLGDRVHYVSDASYDSPDAFSDFEGDGTHVLELPNASADNSLMVKTLPLRIEPRQGDAHVSVPDGRVNRSEPVYRVTPGDTVGDAYDVTFTNATDGEDYILWSETNEIVVDSGTASSPLTLSDDSDNVATMQFRLDDGTAGGSTDSGSGDGGGGVPAPMPTTGGDTNFVPLIGVALVAGLVLVASRNDGAVAETGASAGERIEGVLGGIPIAGPAIGKGLGGLVESGAGLLEAVVGNQTVALSIVSALLIGAVQGGIIEVPQSSLTLIVVAGVGIYSLVGLRELGEFTVERWMALLAMTTIVAVQSLSSESLLTAIVNSDVWPILAISVVVLAYRGVQGLQSPDTVTEVVLDTEQQDGGDGQ